MPMQVNIGGTWKNLVGVFVNIGGSWKTVQESSVKVNGSWKSTYVNERFGDEVWSIVPPDGSSMLYSCYNNGYYYIAQGDHLYKVNPDTGSIIWTYDIEYATGPYGLDVASNGDVVVSDYNHMECVTGDNTMKWYDYFSNNSKSGCVITGSYVAMAGYSDPYIRVNRCRMSDGYSYVDIVDQNIYSDGVIDIGYDGSYYYLVLEKEPGGLAWDWGEDPVAFGDSGNDAVIGISNGSFAYTDTWTLRKCSFNGSSDVSTIWSGGWSGSSANEQVLAYNGEFFYVGCGNGIKKLDGSNGTLVDEFELTDASEYGDIRDIACDDEGFIYVSYRVDNNDRKIVKLVG